MPTAFVLYSEMPDGAVLAEIYLDPHRATSFVDALTEWLADASVEEVVVLDGVPYPHGPEDHRAFQVGTDSFRERRGEDSTLPALRGGFLEGVPAELLGRAMEEELPPTAVYVTPAHPPGPDLDAAIRFLEALGKAHGIDADVTELRQLSEETNRYYAELADRMQKMEDRDSRDDVGYM